MESTTTIDAFPARPDVIASDSVRERFHAVDGMRALAVVSLAFYELVKAFPALFHGASAAAAARQSVHGFDLLALLAGFALAYPAFAVSRQDGAAAFDLGRFAIKRIVRVLPAYATVVALTLLVPVIAHRIGFAQLAGPSGTFPDWRDVIAALGTTSAVPLGNDAIWGAGAIARCYVALPLLLVLWLRFPIGVWLVAIAAATADLMVPSAHALGAGALTGFTLGVIAADLRARGNPLQRFGLPLFAAAAVAGFFANATFGEFAGSAGSGAPAGYVENPMWQVAFFGLLAAAGSSALVERAFGGALFAFLSSASFGIALVAEPVIVFIVRATSASLSAPIAALNAFLMAVAVGIALWAAVDRWFADGPARGLAAERLGRALAVLLRPLHADRIVLRPAGARAALPVDSSDAPAAGFYAPPPRPEATDVASVKRRIGSADDLAAEIRATKHRLAERSAALFSEPEPEKPKPVFKKPGFHGPGFSNAKPAAASLASASPSASTPAIADTAQRADTTQRADTPSTTSDAPVADAAAPDARSLSTPPEHEETAKPASPVERAYEAARAAEEPPPPKPTPRPTGPPKIAVHLQSSTKVPVEQTTEKTDVAESSVLETPPLVPQAAQSPPPVPPREPTPEAEHESTAPSARTAPIAESDLPSLDIPHISLDRAPLDAQKFMAALDTLPTGDGSFDSSAAREFTDQTLGERPVVLDLPTAPTERDGVDEAVELEERDEPPKPEPPRRVNLTLRPDRPIQP
jgi:peptidoglycan/LPS O-acetylase OafA/YrhL